MAATALKTITIDTNVQGSTNLVRLRDGGIKFTDIGGNVTVLRSPEATKLFERLDTVVTTTTTTTTTTAAP